ncbi:MAG: helix-turn-helix domain-containing protein [Ferruginibacter sp.]
MKDLSKWIKLSESHLYCLVSKKKIPFIKLGGKLLFSTIQIRNWIDQNSFCPVVTKQLAYISLKIRYISKKNGLTILCTTLINAQIVFFCYCSHWLSL